jgi:hypothetical protein
MNDPFDATEIDRLVDGELDPAARRDLLNRLDCSPDGWRLCALAFLEGQEFRVASRGWAREHSANITEPSVPVRRRSPARLAIAASLVAVAFSAGFATRGWATVSGVPAASSPRLLAESSPRESPRPVEAAPAPAVGPAPPAMPEYVQAQWARLGYQVKPSRRVISVDEDGKHASFPVDGYRFEFVGRPTY